MNVILGSSAAHRRLLDLVRRAAATDIEVLIEGPSGVGKELYARLIHDEGRRAARPFVAVNCGALPRDLFENELFGHVGGAFTGAQCSAAGLVREANGGTLFLDEIDALALGSQVTLLRLVQQKEYRPLGDARVRKVDVRILAATNAELLNEVRAGRFRSDLFFRLHVFPLRVPPLRERRDDIPLLLAHFIERYSNEYGLARVHLTEDALRRLNEYDWPGNVRELENCARCLICTHPGEEVASRDLPLLEDIPRETPPTPAAPGETFNSAKRRVVSEFERLYLQGSLEAHDGNIAAAARASGKHRRAFFELMRRHGLTRTGH